MSRITLAACGLCLIAGSALDAQTVAFDPPGTAGPAEFKPLIRPGIQVRPVQGGIVIDGRLDDAGWGDAATATGFAEFNPRELVAAAVPVQAWITYDEKTLYVAFRVHDDPTAIRASLRGRDDVLSDDVVAVVLDPFANNATGYLIGANPLGVQVDMRITATSEDWGFDLLYESAGRVTESGYEVEMAIPFSSLQFPNGEVQEWRINFIKLHPRSTMRQYAWGALSQNDSCLLCQNGYLTGLRGIKAGGRVELLPSLVASQSGSLGQGSDPATFRNGRPTADVSLGVRYPFRPGWTAEATYNPDFSQVESDAAQIDVNTTYALSFPERRPFFQEGGELFETPVAQVYTRSINSPVGAGKMVGRQGRVSVGYIGAVDERTPILVPLEERTLFVGAGRSISNILRAEAAVGDGSRVGLLLTDRRYDGGGSGSSVGADARIRLNGQWQIRAQIVASHTAEPDTGALDDRDLTFGDRQNSVALDGESFAGRAAYLNISRSARRLSFGATYRDATPTFRTANGFQSRNDYRNVSAYANWTLWPSTGFVDRATFALQGLQGVNFDGAIRERSVSPSVHVQLKHQTYLNGGVNLANERFDGQMYRSLATTWGSISSAPSEKLSIRIHANGGDWILRQFGEGDVGRGLSVGMNGEIKATSRFVIEPSIAYQRMTDRAGDELFAGYIARSRLGYQFTRELNARVVVQYNDFAEALTIEPLIMYRLNPLSILYFGSTHGYSAFDAPYGFERTDRQFFLKLQYLFRT
jgi:hypothetical protein